MDTPRYGLPEHKEHMKHPYDMEYDEDDVVIASDDLPVIAMDAYEEYEDSKLSRLFGRKKKAPAPVAKPKQVTSMRVSPQAKPANSVIANAAAQIVKQHPGHATGLLLHAFERRSQLIAMRGIIKIQGLDPISGWRQESLQAFFDYIKSTLVTTDSGASRASKAFATLTRDTTVQQAFTGNVQAQGASPASNALATFPAGDNWRAVAFIVRLTAPFNTRTCFTTPMRFCTGNSARERNFLVTVDFSKSEVAELLFVVAENDRGQNLPVAVNKTFFETSTLAGNAWTAISAVLHLDANSAVPNGTRVEIETINLRDLEQ